MDSGVNRIFITIACSATVALAIGYWLKYRRESESDFVIGRKIGDEIVGRAKKFLGCESREKNEEDGNGSGWKVQGERVDNGNRNGGVESFIGNEEDVRGNSGRETKSGRENGEMKRDNEGAKKIRDGIIGEVKSSKKAREDESTESEKGGEIAIDRETVGDESEDNEAAKKAREDENVGKAREDGNIGGAREDGNVEKARVGENIDKAREDENEEKAREDEHGEKAREDGNIEGAREDGNIERARVDGNIEKAREDERIEKALANGVAKVSDEKSIENVVDADSVERVLDDFQKVLDDGTIESLIPEKEWVKIGNLKQLFIYPLKSGRGREIKEATFTEYGLCVLRNGSFPLRDRMFLIYEEGTGEFRTGRNFPTLVLITLAAVTQSRAKLEAVGMPTLTFTVPKPGETDATPIQCSMWWGETLDCIDCGDTVARWISKFVTGTNTGLRVGCTTEKRGEVTKAPWEKFSKAYTNLRNEDTGLYSDLASYMLMTEASVDELNRKLQHPVPALQFRPNIVVSGAKPFQEDFWEWIKIGRDVVIRNVKPCPRFRDQRDEERVKVDDKAPTMGIYCGLYKAGQVKVGDEVYIRYATNESNPKSESDHFIKAEVSINGRTFGN